MEIHPVFVDWNIVEMYIQVKATYRFNVYQNPNDAFFQK